MHDKKDAKVIKNRKTLILKAFPPWTEGLFCFTLPSTSQARIRCGNELNNQQNGEDLMEHINRIELQGRVGTVRLNMVGESMVANFSMVTEHFYKTREGAAVNETTWHQVTAWEGRDMPDLTLISKGTPVNITGRLRTFKYTNAEGFEKQLYEIVAYRVRILSEEDFA